MATPRQELPESVGGDGEHEIYRPRAQLARLDRDHPGVEADRCEFAAVTGNATVSADQAGRGGQRHASKPAYYPECGGAVYPRGDDPPQTPPGLGGLPVPPNPPGALLDRGPSGSNSPLSVEISA